MKNRDVFPPLIFSACTKRGWCSILTIFSKRPGLAEALTRQEPFINQNLAYQALGMLTQLLRHGSLSHHGGFCNLSTVQVVSMPIRAVTAYHYDTTTINWPQRPAYACNQ